MGEAPAPSTEAVGGKIITAQAVPLPAPYRPMPPQLFLTTGTYSTYPAYAYRLYLIIEQQYSYFHYLFLLFIQVLLYYQEALYSQSVLLRLHRQSNIGSSSHKQTFFFYDRAGYSIFATC